MYKLSKCFSIATCDDYKIHYKGVEMKKAKIFLTAIIMTLASALITACSCTDVEFTPIPETGISIECTTADVYSMLDEESGNLTINCYKGERFTIRYTITPSNTTETQVDWAFTKPGILTCSTMTYSKGTIESISFTAFGKGETDIVFTTKTTGKMAKASINVYEEKAKLTELPKPSNFEYDSETGTVSWGAIESRGIVGYELYIQERKIDNTGTSYIDTTVDPVKTEVMTNSYGGFEAGKTYGVRVTAIGDDKYARTGEQSVEFVFHQLAEVAINDVSDGNVTVTTPYYSDTVKVVCEGVDNVWAQGGFGGSVSELGGDSYTFNCSYFGDGNSLKYDLSAIAYPRGYIDGKQDKAQNGVYYYPSKAVNIPTITKLANPTLSLKNIAGTETINGVEFDTVSKTTKLNLQGANSYSNSLNVKYQYFFFNKEQIDGDEATALSNIKVDDNNKEVSFGNDTVKVFISNDAQMSLSTSGCYVYVRMVGNMKNTIGGEWQKVQYKQLGRVMTSGGTANDVQNISISQNIVRVDASSGYMDGVEFYFINLSNKDNSRVVCTSEENICEYDIASLNLPSGSYNVYAKLIGKETKEDLVGGLSGSLYTDAPIATVKVLKSIDELKMTSSGVVSFKGVTYTGASGSSVNIGNYTFTMVLEKLNGDTTTYTMPLNVNATFSDTKVDGVYVTPLTKSGEYYSFDLYDVMRAVRALDVEVVPSEVVIENDVYALLRDYVNYKITIIANSNGEGEEAVISSKASAEMKFGRISNIEPVNLVDREKLQFTSVVGATGYVVEINNVASEVYSSTANEITINLSTLKTASGDKTMLEVIDKSKENVEILVYGVGREAKTTDNQGMLNSFKTQVHFGFSGTPESLSMNANGELSWRASANVDSATTYVVKFYNESSNELTRMTKSYSTGTEADDDKREYVLNVSSILANYEGQKIYITISENQPNTFAKGDNAKFYAMKLTTTNVIREIKNDKKLISWDSVANATGYIITCSEAIFDGTESDSNATRWATTSYELPSDLSVGTYTFTIVAYATNDENSGHSANAPYIISSSDTQTKSNNPTTSVIYSDGQTTAVARGEKVVWSYNSDYMYAVSYRVTDGNWTTVNSDDITTIEGRLEKSFSLSTVDAGSYEVKIISSVDYVEKGVILTGNERVSAVDKLEAVTNVKAEGRLQFNVPEALRESDLTFEICNNGVAMDPSSYFVSVGDVRFVDFINIPSGTMKITIKVKAEGKIDSKYTAEYSVTKIENVSGFERSGEYLKWAPVSNATYYEILEDGASKKYTLKAELLSGGNGYTCQIVAEDGSVSTNETKFKYDGSMLVFKPDDLAEGAHTYSISAKTGLTGYINGNSNSISVTKLRNTVEVSVGLGVFEYGYYEVLDGEESPVRVEIKIYRLKEKTASGDEGEAVVASENGYEIDTTYDPIVTTISFAEYSSLATIDGGKYSIGILGLENYDAEAQYGTTIMFIGNNANILSSDETALYCAPKIAPVSVSTANGMLTWTGLNNAIYAVEISDDTGVVVTFDISGTSDSITLPATLCDGMDGISNLSGVSVGGDDSGEDMEGNGDEGDIEIQSLGGTFNYVAGVEYSIRVSAKVSGNLRSEWSEPFKFKKLLAITDLNMKVVNQKPVLSWTNPNDKSYEFSIALGYYNIDDQSKEISVGDAYHDTLYRELSYDLPVGDYYIRMQAKGNTNQTYGLLTSDVSATSNNCKVTYIANDTNPEVKNGKLTWDAFASAYSYKVVFTNEGNTYSTYTSANELDLNSSDVADGIRKVSGYWNIQVIALTDPKIAMISTSKDNEATDKTKTYRPGELTTFKIKDGKLSWTISYEEINAYMKEIDAPEIDGSEEGDEMGGIATASETGEKYAWGDASTIIPYIKDKAVSGESTEILYDQINLEHYLKVKLNISGTILEVSPTEARTIDDSGKTVEDKKGTKIEFCYDVEISSNNGGLYEFSVTPYGADSVLDGVTSGTISAYKLATPTSWYDEVETKEPVMDENDEPMLDGEGNQVYNTVKVKTDIKDGKALWQLITTNNGTEYYKKYTLTATPDGEGVSSSVKIEVADEDKNISDDYKYSRDLKELFYNGENNVLPDTIYNLFLQANGTEDSTTDTTGRYYLNSNKYAFGDTMTILKECKPTVENGNYLWNPNNNSISSKLVIYGPLNYEGATPNGTLVEEENWATNKDTLTMLAKIMYANTRDASVFEKYNITDEETVKALRDEVDNNITTYLSFVKTVTFSMEDSTKSSQYTLTDKEYSKGGYAIFEQEIGNRKGIVDSLMSDVNFAYKLGTTSATRTLSKTKNGETKSVDYWLGKDTTAGMFTWKEVPLANAYRLTLWGIDPTVEDAQKKLLEENVIVYGRNYYDLNETKDYENTNFEYSLEIVAERREDVHGGSESTPNYSMVAGYFASDKVQTDKEAVFDNGESMVTGRYRRIDGPEELQIDDKGVITWNDGSTRDNIYQYLVSYSWGQGTKNSDDTSNQPTIEVLNTILGTTTIRVRAIAKADEECLNSCYSDDLTVTKIAPPEPTVSDGVFGWGTEGDQMAGQSVTSSNLKVDGTEVTLSSTQILEYIYFTEVDEDNYTTYLSSKDLSKFTVGDHTLSIKYNGSTGSSKDTKNFYIASEEKLYYVTKLQTPTLSHYTKEGNDAIVDGGNKIYWNMIENAEAYKLKFFVAMEGGIKVYTYIINMNEYKVTFIHPDQSSPQVTSIENAKWNDNEYFAIKDNNIIFKMENLLGGNGVGSSASDKGLDIRAFVQAVGTLASSTEKENSADNRDYLSSSYSDGVPVSIPSAPKGASYNANGELSWSLTTESDANKNYNILLVAEYKIERVSYDVQLNWLHTADKTGHDTSNFLSAGKNTENTQVSTRGDDIIERIVLSMKNGDETYNIYVQDTILVKSINGKMPLSYKVTAVATYTSFKLTTTAYEDAKDGVYKSTTLTYLGDGVNPMEFKLFASGNGTSLLPYDVNSEASLKSMYMYPNSYYVITSDIVLSESKSNWDIIDAFGGNIDGRDHLISNVKANFKAVDNGTKSYISFINENSGTVKNLRLQINYSTTSTATEYCVAGLAIENKGTIDNVHIVPLLKTSNDKTDYSNSTKSIISVTAVCNYAYVGGLVVNNYGTIANSSVLADITVLVDKTVSASATPVGRVGGIAWRLTGSSDATIVNSCFKSEMNGETLFSGSITSNYIGGIVEMCDVASTISKCYVDKGVELTLTDKTYTDTNYKTSGNLGGIIATATAGVTIDTCYSLATIKVDIAGSDNTRSFALGGILGVCNSNSEITIRDCYAVVNCNRISTNNATIKLYGIVLKDSNVVTVENCYYVVASTGNTAISIDANSDGISKTLDTLKTSVSKDKYDTTGTYPTIKEESETGEN